MVRDLAQALDNHAASLASVSIGSAAGLLAGSIDMFQRRQAEPKISHAGFAVNR